MKRIVSFCIAALAVQVMSAGVCEAQRRGDPSPEDLVKIKAAAPKQATAKPAKPRKMLVLSYQSHDDGRFAGERALEIMAEQTGAYTLEYVRSPDGLAEAMVPENLRKYDAVCVNNSTGGDGNSKNGKTHVENLNDYVAGGGGLVGIHAATDNKMGEVFGGFFTGHPWSEEVGIRIDDPDHTLTKGFDGKGFMVNDEIYQFNKIYTREKLRILLTLDMEKTKDKGARQDRDNAVAWVKQLGKGRIFYGSLGHNPKVFQDANLLRFYLDGIQFALGDIKADMTPSGPIPESKRFKPQAVVIPKSLERPKDGIQDGYLVAWEYAGPYLDDEPFEMPFAPEQPNPGKIMITWKPMPHGLDAGRPFVLGFEFMPGVHGDQRAIYVRTNVFSPSAQAARLELGSDDGITVWLNGERVHGNNAMRGINPNEDKVAVKLRNGWNALLVKVSQGGGNWAACVALRQPDGGALADLRCEAGAPKIPVTMPEPKKVVVLGPDFVEKYTGEYAGALEMNGSKVEGLAQIVALGKGKYRAAIMDGMWQTAPGAKQFRVELEGVLDEEGNVPLEGAGWKGLLVGQKTLTAKSAEASFNGRWNVRKSPTLGAEPPAGAVVLLPFNEGEKPSLDAWEKQWEALDSGAMRVRGGDNYSNRKFGSIKLHVEFRCPYEPTKRGQGRGNSGVYLQKRYEVQVLESFGLKSQSNDCGSIYQVANTRVNACLPPEQWQTYDIEFTAAKIGGGGKIERQPAMTVRHNGIPIHENQVLPGHTTAAAASGYTATDSLQLQDHGNPVQYRNIWVVELAD